jgi:hypothetical protein
MMRDTSWQHDPSSFYAHMMDMLVSWYPYSGDEEAAGVLREILDYQLAHGTTAADWPWADVPFATSCAGDKEYGRCFQDVPAEFYGGIEYDKIGELGLAYVLFYELTGERKYLSAGTHCAAQLAKHVVLAMLPTPRGHFASTRIPERSSTERNMEAWLSRRYACLMSFCGSGKMIPRATVR